MSHATLSAAPTLDPYRIAPDTWVIPEPIPTPVGFSSINSMVIVGREPIVVDTGMAINRERFFEKVGAIVDPRDVRWIFLSHDDTDHSGNLLAMLEAAPNATLVTNWFAVERMAADFELPIERLRWVNNGESFDAGDRTLLAIRPPTFDGPTTRGLFDSKTGAYWAVDCFGALMPSPTSDAAEVPADMYEEGFLAIHRLISPWHQMLDTTKFNRLVDQVSALPIKSIGCAHGPALYGDMVQKGFELLRRLPEMENFAEPTQAVLEQLQAAAQAELLVAA
jgi:flavorubredoxin